MKKFLLVFCLMILQAGLLCGCRLPHKKRRKKKSRGRQKLLRQKIRNCHFSESRSIKTAVVQELHFSGMWTVNLQ